MAVPSNSDRNGYYSSNQRNQREQHYALGRYGNEGRPWRGNAVQIQVQFKLGRLKQELRGGRDITVIHTTSCRPVSTSLARSAFVASSRDFPANAQRVNCVHSSHARSLRLRTNLFPLATPGRFLRVHGDRAEGGNLFLLHARHVQRSLAGCDPGYDSC